MQKSLQNCIMYNCQYAIVLFCGHSRTSFKDIVLYVYPALTLYTQFTKHNLSEKKYICIDLDLFIFCCNKEVFILFEYYQCSISILISTLIVFQTITSFFVCVFLLIKKSELPFLYGIIPAL